MLYYVLLCYVILYHTISYDITLTFFSAEQGRFEHHPASKDRTPHPPFLFYAVQAGFQEQP